MVKIIMRNFAREKKNTRQMFENDAYLFYRIEH